MPAVNYDMIRDVVLSTVMDYLERKGKPASMESVSGAIYLGGFGIRNDGLPEVEAAIGERLKISMPKSLTPQFTTVGDLARDAAKAMLEQRPPLLQEYLGEVDKWKVLEAVKRVLEEDLAVRPEEMDALDTHYIDDLGFDSLDETELVTGLGEAFGMSIPDENVTEITTIRKTMNYIMEVFNSRGYCPSRYMNPRNTAD
jgi:acyl carrier protein